MAKKYNWAEIKLEYMMSKVLVVSEFLEQKFGSVIAINNGNFNAETAGWRWEKEELYKQAHNEAMKDLAKSIRKEYAPNVKELGDIIRWVVDLSKVAIKFETDKCIIRGKDWSIEIVKAPDLSNVERAYKIAKNELGESSETTKVVTISDEDKTLLDKVLEDNL